jgi:hypothetical protein
MPPKNFIKILDMSTDKSPIKIEAARVCERVAAIGVSEIEF